MHALSRPRQVECHEFKASLCHACESLPQINKQKTEQDMVVHACNPNTSDDEAGGLLQNFLLLTGSYKWISLVTLRLSEAGVIIMMSLSGWDDCLVGRQT